jgi:hypothetical protein
MMLFEAEVPGRQIHAMAIALPTPRPASGSEVHLQDKAISLRVAAVNERLAEFHALAGHAGPADGCQDCASAQRRQRQAAAALRAHRRQARQQVDAIVGRAVAS